MSFSSLRPQFVSNHHTNSRLRSHSYSHESVIFVSYFWDSYILSYGEVAFVFSLNACCYAHVAVDQQITAGQSIMLRKGTSGCAQWPQLLGCGGGAHYI